MSKLVAVGISVEVKGERDVLLTIDKTGKFLENPPTRELWTNIFRAMAKIYENRFRMAKRFHKTRIWPPYRPEYGRDTDAFYRSLTQPSGAVRGVRIKRKWIAHYGHTVRHGEWVSGGVPGRAARKIGIRTRRAKNPMGVLIWRGAPGKNFIKLPRQGKPAETTDRKPPKDIRPAKILLKDKDLTLFEKRRFDKNVDRYIKKHLMSIK